MSRILAVDAGFQALGLVVVEGERVQFALAVRTERTAKKRGVRVADDDAERCALLARSLAEVIAAHHPVAAVVELPTGGAQGARANRAMGMATGVVVAMLEQHRLPAEWVTPADVKKAATGRRDGSKDDVQRAVCDRLAWGDHWPRHAWAQEHVADAAAAFLAAQHGTLLRAVASVGRETA